MNPGSAQPRPRGIATHHVPASKTPSYALQYLAPRCPRLREILFINRTP